MTSSLRYDDPKRYEWSEAAREDYADTFWQCPVSLVLDSAEEGGGLWRLLWETCPSATSLLPVLAVDAYPAMRHDALERDMKQLGRPMPPDTPPRVPACWPADSPPVWTKWAYSSRRRMAALSGLNKDTVTTALTALKSRGLVETVNGPRKQYGGGRKTYYRLRINELFPVPTRPEYIEFPAKLLHAGTWAMLPTNAARHLYFVLACRDGVRHETPFLASSYSEPETAAETRQLLTSARRAHPVSLADMERASGMGYRTVSEALQILTTPLFGEKPCQIALVETGTGATNGVCWYAPDRRAWGWHWKVELLNRGAASWDEQRRAKWPWLYARRAQTTPAQTRRPRHAA